MQWRRRPIILQRISEAGYCSLEVVSSFRDSSISLDRSKIIMCFMAIARMDLQVIRAKKGLKTCMLCIRMHTATRSVISLAEETGQRLTHCLCSSSTHSSFAIWLFGVVIALRSYACSFVSSTRDLDNTLAQLRMSLRYPVVNRYKNDNFCAEEEDRQEAHRQECEKRRLRMTRETGPGQTGDMIKPDSRRPSILVLPPLSNDLEAQSPNTGSEVSW
jgi:hypothetical protein